MPFSAALDDNKPIAMDRDSAEPLSSSSVPNSLDGLSGAVADSTSLDDRLDAESQYQQQRIKQWKEGPFATGFTEQTWEADYNKFRHNLGGECSKCMDNEDTMPCGCCSAVVCSALGAGRVGNIAVLKETEERGEDGERRRKLLIVAGKRCRCAMVESVQRKIRSVEINVHSRLSILFFLCFFGYPVERVRTVLADAYVCHLPLDLRSVKCHTIHSYSQGPSGGRSSMDDFDCRSYRSVGSYRISRSGDLTKVRFPTPR